MLRRPPGQARHVAPRRKYLITLAFLLVPWLRGADAQQQHPHHVASLVHQNDLSSPPSADHRRPLDVSNEVGDVAAQVHQLAAPDRRRPPRLPPSRNLNNLKQPSLNVPHPSDARAITLAPDQSVRAPASSRLKSVSVEGGLTTPQIARSLGDWEMEDFVLLATIDGHLYASDRQTGEERWHLALEQPAVETKHHRTNVSVLDDDHSPIDHFIWAVEPNRDGELYLWNPVAPGGGGVVKMGLTMKQMVEDLAPYFHKEQGILYTGDKKTALITLDLATGRVLKWFGSTSSHVDDAESCLRPTALLDTESGCEDRSSITLGRTEYTVGIHYADGRPIATLKYFEWGSNTFDNDLLQQYHETLDKQYITGQHDGRFYGFNYDRRRGTRPLFAKDLPNPIAKVFDVARPYGAPPGSNPGYIVLPQPLPPAHESDYAAAGRDHGVFLNQTIGGSWYAMSSRAYPLIIDAPPAQINNREWWDRHQSWQTLDESQISQALVGTHFIDGHHLDHLGLQPSLPTLPDKVVASGPPLADDECPIVDDVSAMPSPHSSPLPPEARTLLNHAMTLSGFALVKVIELLTNPVMIIIFVTSFIYYHHDLRRCYGRLKIRYFSDPSTPRIDPTTAATPDVDPTDSVSAIDAAHLSLPEPSITAEGGKRDAMDNDAAVLVRPDDALKHDESKPPPPIVVPSSGGGDGQTIPAPAAETMDPTPDGLGLEPAKRKKAHRGRRGGVKHKKNKEKRDSPSSQSQGDVGGGKTVDEVADDAKKLGEGPRLEPDIQTVTSDVTEVSGPILKMGSLEVNEDQQLGTGSNGTVVFAGKWDGRDVAVKRMLIQFNEIASQETRLLRESDDHPNVIRYYAQQQRAAFLYIALELCKASLADVVQKPQMFRELVQVGERNLQGVLYQIANGLDHLHGLRIVHRDLKPQNILINIGKDGRPRLLVSDFGLCKKLEGGQSSFGATTAHAAGTHGWRAPELLVDDDVARGVSPLGLTDDPRSNTGRSGSSPASGDLAGDIVGLNSRRVTRAIDIFSLGLVFYFVLTKGSHPFDCGDRYMREVNIRKGDYNLVGLDVLGEFALEARDLIQSMLDASPKRRPSTQQIMAHPFFWSTKKRLNFLCDVSDHFEKETRDPPSAPLQELERFATETTHGDFLKNLPKEFVESLGKQRKYTGSRLLDLLRALRNKKHHYEDMSDSLKRAIGPLPEGYLGFWTRRFPMLLINCWRVVKNVDWVDTDRFREYYEPAGL